MNLSNDAGSPATHYMRLVLNLARKGYGTVSPNPLVGCLIVKHGQIIGRGFHRRAGQPHAEVYALDDAGPQARGADLYVNLEPCSHVGRTGPCVDRIIAAGIKRVFAAMVDPNPLVCGHGLEKLRAAGIAVESGIREREARRLNEAFCKYITTHQPFVCLKLAASLDGKTVPEKGQSPWITGAQSRRYVHLLRDRYDAVMVGAQTVIADNPELTTRLPYRQGKNPIRIVIDGALRTPLSAKLVETAAQIPTIIATQDDHPSERFSPYLDAGCEIMSFPAQNGQISLASVMKALGKKGITSILVEGGARLSYNLWQADLIDKCIFMFAPKILAGGVSNGMFTGLALEIPGGFSFDLPLDIRRVGPDFMVIAYKKRIGL